MGRPFLFLCSNHKYIKKKKKRDSRRNKGVARGRILLRFMRTWVILEGGREKGKGGKKEKHERGRRCNGSLLTSSFYFFAVASLDRK